MPAAHPGCEGRDGVEARAPGPVAGAVPARLAAAAAVLSLLVVLVGGVVRVTGSGLGCPDWPLCYGGVVPPSGGAALIEFSHRLVAGAFALVIYVLAYRCRPGRIASPMPGPSAAVRSGLSRLAIAAAVLVTAQALLGGANVLTELAPAVGGAHLILATVVVGLLSAAAVVARAAADPAGGGRTQDRFAQPGVRAGAVSAALALVVVGIGGYVRALGASLACTDWPLCGGGVVPPPGWPFWLQWGHRVAALALGAAIAAGAVRSRGGAAWWAAALLYVAQVGLGAAAVRWQLPPAVRVLHLGVATLLVAVLSAETAQAWLRSVRGRSQALGRRASAAGSGIVMGG